MLFGDGPKGNKFANTGVGENNIYSPLHLRDRLVKTIEVSQLGNISLNARNVAADCLYGLVEFLLAAARDEDIGTLLDEKLCRSQSNPFCAAGDDGGLAIEFFGHSFSPLFLCLLSRSLLDRGQRRIAAPVPPATKSAEGAHGGAGCIRSGALHIIPCNEKLTIRVKNVGQRNCAGLVGSFRKIASPRKRDNFALQLLQPHLSLRKLHQRVLYIFGGSQGGLPIPGKRFGVAAARLGDLSCDLSKIEKPPPQRSRPNGLKRFPVEKSASAGAVETKRAGKRNLGVVVGDRNADSLVRGGKPTLGRDDVGPPAQDIERLVGATNRRNSGNCAWLGKLFCVRSRLSTHEDIETVQLRFKRHTQGGHRRLGLLKKCFRLGNFPIVRHSHPSTHFDQLQKMCIGIYELLRNRKPRLILPHLKVGVRRLGGDGDSSPNLLGLCSLEFISSRRFAAAQPSGKIDFPARRSSNCVLPLIASVAWKTIRSRTKRIHNALVHGCARRLQIGCRQKLRSRRRCCRSGLADTRKGSGKIEILAQGALHDRHKHRVVEARPPTFEKRCRKFRLRRADGGEIMKWSEIGGGLHIAWTHGTTTCK